MEAGYSGLQSSSLFVECFRESMPLVVTGILLYSYYRQRIGIIDMLLYAFATEAYTMLIIGPTFTATFFVSIFILVDQAHRLFTGNLYIRKEYFILLILPLLSHIAVILTTQLYKDPFFYPNNSATAFYLRPLYFYIKTYLPLFAIGAKIVQERDQYSFEQFMETMKRISIVSCVIGAGQLVVHMVFRNVELGELLGLQHRYLVEGINGPLGIRPQALFSEPKTFSAFLSLSIPIFLRDRQYRAAFLAFAMGVITSSQTFWINLLAAGILFFVWGKVYPVRAKVLGTLGIIIGIFLLVAQFKDYLLQHYVENRNQPVYKFIFERSAYRYDNEYWQKDNIILGLPLQRDMELPVVDFLKDEPYLLWTGYGGGNSTFIPSQYFFGQMSYANHLAGIGGQNLNMRWFYILAEFGGVALLFFFFMLTRASGDISRFNRNYLAYVATCFFFSQIDLFLVITAILTAYGPGKEEEFVGGEGLMQTAKR